MLNTRLIAASLVGVMAYCHTSPLRAEQAPKIELEFLAELVVPKSASWSQEPVGGLSGVDYDESTGRYLFISDDGAVKGPARFYEGTIDVSSSGYQAQISRQVELKNRHQDEFKAGSLDPESLRLNRAKALIYWSSEGNVKKGVGPFVRVANEQGHFVSELTLPAYYLPNPERGIRHNQGFESLSFAADGSMIYTATESALLQDGASDSLEQGSLCRWLVWDTKTHTPQAEYVYLTDPVVAAPAKPDDFYTNGLVEILALDHEQFLALERSFTAGKGTDVRLYLTSTQGATNTLGKSSLKLLGKAPSLMSKELLFHLNELPVTMDNVEGMTLGPELKDGRRLLVLVADDNFSDQQKNQILLFAFKMKP